MLVGKQHAVPGKHRVALYAQVVHGIAEGIRLVLAHTAHLILTSLQIVEYPGLIVELGIDGQRLHRHTDGVQETLVGTTVVDGGEERLLFIIIFGQQEAVGRREEIALEYAILLAECVHLGHLHVERPHHTGLAVFRILKIGHQLCEAVAAVEVLCIPLLAFVKGSRLAQFGLSRCHLGHRHRLWFQRTASVDLVYVAEHHLQGGAVADDVVDVEEEVEMFRILEQADMEKTILVDVEGRDEWLTIKKTSIFKVQCSVLNVQRKRLRIVDGLKGVALVIQFDAREQRGMCCHSGLNGPAKLVPVQRAVEHVEIRKVITSLSLMSYTLHIEAILYF